MENEITLVRALSELKTIRKRIEKLQNRTVFIGTKITGKAYKDFTKEAKSNYQAINDLYHRYNAIKFGIMRSNATVKVTINGCQLTVAEAIVMKESMEERKNLLKLMRSQRSSVSNAVSLHEQTVQTELNKLLSKMCQNQDNSSDQTHCQVFSEGYRQSNKIEVIDPLNLDKEIEKLDTEIDNFFSEVDFALSESNALNKISLK